LPKDEEGACYASENHAATVLIVDEDNDMVCGLSQGASMRRGRTVSISNAFTALEVLGRRLVDVLLTDC
jgi:DNA-binding NtrC family response regulator